MSDSVVKIIGAGLAGTEAAYQLLKEGVAVRLYEMRPLKTTPAHKTGDFAELVCSNSLKSRDPETAHGLLKQELKAMGSLILESAEESQVPAGAALAVDRIAFSNAVKRRLSRFEGLTVEYAEAEDAGKDGAYWIVASGPMTAGVLAENLKELTGGFLSFFDAVAPIVSAESVDMTKAFFASRYGKGDAEDYLNCPMNKEEYTRFAEALIDAECAEIKAFDEGGSVFSGCMPVEVMAKRGIDSLRFGPLKPVGIVDADGKRHYAIVQLRKENSPATMYNLVGFQTHLTFSEQRRVFSMIPALSGAEFLRYGVMHRNSFVNAPKVLNSTFSLKSDGKIYIAGQLSGVEGYVESAMSGLIAAKNVLASIRGEKPFLPPAETLTGALCRYIAGASAKDFQPMNGNYGLMEPILCKDKRLKKQMYAKFSDEALTAYLAERSS